jgi:predicted CopG family antitoxin
MMCPIRKQFSFSELLVELVENKLNNSDYALSEQ